MKNVILYARVSTEMQSADGVSLDAQVASLQKYATDNDLTVVEVIRETASAKDTAREGLQRALSSLRRRKADAIIITKLDRLTRSVGDLSTLLKDDFRRGGLISVSESVDTTTPCGRLLLNVMTSTSEWEREAIGERTRTALQHKKTLGQRVGTVPFGKCVDADGITLVDNPDEQRVIEKAKALKVAGFSLRQISEALAARGMMSRQGTPLAPSAIARMV